MLRNPAEFHYTARLADSNRKNQPFLLALSRRVAAAVLRNLAEFHYTARLADSNRKNQPFFLALSPITFSATDLGTILSGQRFACARAEPLRRRSAQEPERPLAVPLGPFADYLFGYGLGNFGIVVELHRELTAALRARTKVGCIAEHL